MKTYIVSLALCLVFTLTSCSKNTIGNLFDEAKKSDNYIAFTIPKWVIKTTKDKVFEGHLGTSNNSYNLLNHVDKVRVLVQDDKSKLNMGSMKNIFNNITNDKHYEEYLTVREGDQHTSIVVNERKDRVKDILLFTESDDSVVLLHLKSDISVKDLEDGRYFQKLMK